MIHCDIISTVIPYMHVHGILALRVISKFHNTCIDTQHTCDLLYQRYCSKYSISPVIKITSILQFCSYIKRHEEHSRNLTHVLTINEREHFSSVIQITLDFDISRYCGKYLTVRNDKITGELYTLLKAIFPIVKPAYQQLDTVLLQAYSQRKNARLFIGNVSKHDLSVHKATTEGQKFIDDLLQYKQSAKTTPFIYAKFKWLNEYRVI